MQICTFSRVIWCWFWDKWHRAGGRTRFFKVFLLFCCKRPISMGCSHKCFFHNRLEWDIFKGNYWNSECFGQKKKHFCVLLHDLIFVLGIMYCICQILTKELPGSLLKTFCLEFLNFFPFFKAWLYPNFIPLLSPHSYISVSNIPSSQHIVISSRIHNYCQ